ncbi:MAG: Ada metal-binding domain-containing protein [Sedimentisphaeraceae bacterium JB056]
MKGTRILLAALLTITLMLNPIIAQEKKQESCTRQYGDAKVSKFVSCGNGLEFVCCIDSWPEIIGRDITVKIAGITEPQNITGDKEFYHEQLAIFLEKKLKDSKITLCNICRDSESFAIIADVKVDGLYIAPELIKHKLAELKTPKPLTASPPAKTEEKPQAKQQLKEQAEQTTETAEETNFICSKNSKIFHKKDCTWIDRIKPENRVTYETREEAVEAGKRPCSKCKP